MAPPSDAVFNGTHVLATSSSSTTSETITNIVFGLCALTGSGVVIWQGRNAWKMWMKFHGSRASAEGMPTTDKPGMKGSRKSIIPSGYAPQDHIVLTIIALPDLPHELEAMHLASNTPMEDGSETAGRGASNESSSATAPPDDNTAPLQHISVSRP